MTKNPDYRDPNPNAGTPATLDDTSLDALRLNQFKYFTAKTDNSKYNNLTVTAPTGGQFYDTAKETEKIIQDKLELTSVTIVGYNKVYDPVTNALKYDAVLKIMNTSINPSEIAGVEAQIAPRGA